MCDAQYVHSLTMCAADSTLKLTSYFTCDSPASADFIQTAVARVNADAEM